eukprot:2670923-Pyramimonas_sp.AAC.1
MPGPQAAAPWGAGVSGLSGRKMHNMRRAAVAGLHVDRTGASVGLDLATAKTCRAMGSFCLYHSQVVGRLPLPLSRFCPTTLLLFGEVAPRLAPSRLFWFRLPVTLSGPITCGPRRPVLPTISCCQSNCWAGRCLLPIVSAPTLVNKFVLPSLPPEQVAWLAHGAARNAPDVAAL